MIKSPNFRILYHTEYTMNAARYGIPLCASQQNEIDPISRPAQSLAFSMY